MKRIFYSGFLIISLALHISCTNRRIDRQKVVSRHNIITTETNPQSPAQVGNGEFAFAVDITGLQTFIPFNTMSHWSWHSFPIPGGLKPEDFNGVTLNTHGRAIEYPIPGNEHQELSEWLAGNPHRFNLGRIGFLLYRDDGTIASVNDLEKTRQETDLWKGIITSTFQFEGKPVEVITACHPSKDAVGVSVRSELVETGQIKVFFDFPYADAANQAVYVGDYSNEDAHLSHVERQDDNSAVISRKMDDVQYSVSIFWKQPAGLIWGDTISSRHRFILDPLVNKEFQFTFCFSKEPEGSLNPDAEEIFSESSLAWRAFWESGAAIDLSHSSDERWKELERRIVLSQYLMRVNEAG